jgi:hypothetical protein
MAKHADKYALVRSVYHTAAAVHDTGHQMMQTGWLFQGGIEYPNIGCVLSKLKGPKGDVPPHVLMPHPIGNAGGNMPHGQTAGYSGRPTTPSSSMPILHREIAQSSCLSNSAALRSDKAKVRSFKKRRRFWETKLCATR